jgi:hypothetical protein
MLLLGSGKVHFAFGNTWGRIILDGPGRSGSELQAKVAAWGVAAEQALLSFAPSFVRAALGFLWGENACAQPFQVLELVVDRAVSETRRLLGSGGDSECQHAQQEGEVDGEGRLGDVLVAAFQLAASLLAASRQSEELVLGPRTQQPLYRQCEELLDALWVVGAHDAEPMDQRRLWRELLCRRWDEAAASLALELLLLRADVACARGDSMRADEVVQVVAFAYAQLPAALKELCLDQVAALVHTVVDEGPSLAFSPRMSLQLQLLDRLAAVRFLDNSAGLDVAAWIDEHFADCFECCGVALQLLSEPLDDEGEGRGLVRMLDMCLLVLRAGFDYFASKEHDIVTLQRILRPSIAAALSQLLAARLAIPAHTEARAVDTSLHLLARMGDVLGEDGECEAFAPLLDPSAAASITAAMLRSTCSDAMHELLARSSIAKAMSPLTALLRVDGLEDLHAEHVGTVEARSLEDAKAEEIAHRFPAESEGTAEGVAGLLSSRDLGDARCPGKPDAHCVEHQVDADEEAASVAAASVEVPQWFDDEDSADELEADTSLPLLPQVDEDESQDDTSSANAEWSIPQRFDDVEEGVDIKAPLWTLEEDDSSAYPEVRMLLSLERADEAASNDESSSSVE